MATKPADMAIKGGILVSSEGMIRGDVFITDGVVDGVEAGDSMRSASRVIDASGKFVLPGILDVHLHPVYADKIDTISKTAACVGITTLIPYIGAIKAWGITGGAVETIKQYIADGEKCSVVDFGVHCSLTQSDMETVAESIPQLVEMGVISFKAFMAYSKRGMQLRDDELLRLMEVVSENKAVLALHAESGSILDYLEHKFTVQGNLGPEFYYPSHPNIAEAEAVFRALSLAKVVGCPLYLPHLSARESLEVVRLFKQWDGPPFFTETCTHYLILTDEEMTKKGALAKVAPPLRTQKDVEEMWKAVQTRLIDVLGSDACGYKAAAKAPHGDDIFKAPYGIPGLDTMFSVAYDEGVNKGRITLPRLVELTCENPARIFGLYPKKGVLKEGSDADVVIFDPALSHTIRAEDLPLNCDYGMYEGRECLGAPNLVIQRGNILMEDGHLRAEPGQGRHVPGKN
jgi:dihydropyrimidinase